MSQHGPLASASLFPLGQVVITANAVSTLCRPSIDGALRRHARGDWGTLCPEDADENARSLRDGGWLLSVYEDHAGRRFWIIAEADRSVTTILLPEDY